MCKLYRGTNCQTEVGIENCVKEEFISKFTLCDDDESLCIVPATAIVHPLLVFDDLGGDSKDYFCSLPRRNWSRYFGDKIEC